MELKFDFYSNRFAESHSTSKDDFRVKIDTLISYYKSKTEPPTIQIRIWKSDPDDFLWKRIDLDPRIHSDEGLTHIYFSIKKTKDKLK